MEYKTKSDINKREPIAIVGMGCRFPGDANSPDEFWKLLLDAKDAIVDIPPDRWDVDAFYDPDYTKAAKISVRQGGFIKDIDKFDAGFFGISPKEAVRIDPQQRILLELSYNAIDRWPQRQLCKNNLRLRSLLPRHQYRIYR